MVYESRDSSDSFLLWGRLRPWRPALSKEQAITLMKTTKREIPRSNWNHSQNFHWFVLQHDFPGVFFPRVLFGIQEETGESSNQDRKTIYFPWGQWGSMADHPETLPLLYLRSFKLQFVQGRSSLDWPQNWPCFGQQVWLETFWGPFTALMVLWFLNRNHTRAFSATIISTWFYRHSYIHRNHLTWTVSQHDLETLVFCLFHQFE